MKNKKPDPELKSKINQKKKHIQNRKKYIDHYFVRGLYYLWNGYDIVYVGMSTTNVMSRILDHYRAGKMVFDGFTIREIYDMSDAQLREKEYQTIAKKRPLYNIQGIRNLPS